MSPFFVAFVGSCSHLMNSLSLASEIVDMFLEHSKTLDKEEQDSGGVVYS